MGTVALVALSPQNQSVVGFYVRPFFGIPELLEPEPGRNFAWISCGALKLSIEARRTTGKVVLVP